MTSLRGFTRSGQADQQTQSVTVSVPVEAQEGDVLVVAIGRWWETTDQPITAPGGFVHEIAGLHSAGSMKLDVFHIELGSGFPSTFDFSWALFQYTTWHCVALADVPTPADPFAETDLNELTGSIAIPDTAVSTAGFLLQFTANENLADKTLPGFTEVSDSNYLATFTGSGTTANGGTMNRSTQTLAALLMVPEGATPVELDGSTAVSASVGGSLVSQRSLEGPVLASNSLSGSLNTVRQIEGTLDASVGLTGALTATHSVVLGGAASSSVSLTGSLSTTLVQPRPYTHDEVRVEVLLTAEAVSVVS